MNKRKETRQLAIGSVRIGGDAPVVVQSMCNTDTRDAESTLQQIRQLEEAGCEVARLAIPDFDAARALGKIRAGTHLPLVADIHFDYRLALESVKQGVDGLRINPGNIGSRAFTRSITTAFQKNTDLPVVKLTVPFNGWILPSVRLSDHASFWDQGYRAVMITDSAFFRNPHYHLSSDTMETLDLRFMAELVESLVIFFVSQGSG